MSLFTSLLTTVKRKISRLDPESRSAADGQGGQKTMETDAMQDADSETEKEEEKDEEEDENRLSIKDLIAREHKTRTDKMYRDNALRAQKYKQELGLIEIPRILTQYFTNNKVIIRNKIKKELGGIAGDLVRVSIWPDLQEERWFIKMKEICKKYSVSATRELGEIIRGMQDSLLTIIGADNSYQLTVEDLFEAHRFLDKSKRQEISFRKIPPSCRYEYDD